MSLYNKIPSNVEKGQEWLETEIRCAEALYSKLKLQISDTDDIYLPSPIEFFQDYEELTELWFNFKDNLLQNYEKTHSASLAEKKRIQEDKLEYWCRTEDENIAHALKVQAEYDNGTRVKYEFPPEFETDTNALREFLGSEICTYYGMIIEINRILIKDFPDLVVEEGESFEETDLAIPDNFGSYSDTKTEVTTVPGTTTNNDSKIKII